MNHSVLPPLGDPSLHFWITHSVARTMGLRFTEAMTRGALSADDFAELVTACQRCKHVAACVTRLGRAEATEGQPDYCGNKGKLEGLATRL